MVKYIRNISVIQKIIFFYVCCLYIGPDMLSVDVGIMHLSIGRFLQPIIVGMCLYKIATYSLERPLKIPSCPNTYSMCFFACWFAYAILSIIWVKDYYAWLRYCYFLFGGIITIFVISFYLYSLDNIKSLLHMSMIMTFLHALIGCYEIQSGNYLFLQDMPQIEVYIRESLPVSSMGNVNDYATAILIGFYSSIAVYLTTHRKMIRSMVALVIFFLLIMMILTGSRSIILGLCFSLMTTSLLYTRARRKFMLVGAITILLFIITMIILPDMRENLVYYCDMLFNLDFQNEDSSDSIRLNLILNGLNYLKNTWFMGTGIGNIEYYMRNYLILDTHNIMIMHNWWMEILVSSGIFIFTGYCLFYWRLCRQMWRLSKYANDRDVRKIGSVMLGFLIAFTIASISSSSLMGNDIVWFFFATIIAFEGIAGYK